MAALKRHLVSSLAVVFFVLISGLNAAENILYGGETLATGTHLRYKRYTFVCQTDCNLVLYDNGNPVWATNTGGLATNCYCTLHNNGNLVVYAPSNRKIWASNTGSGNVNCVLILQKDRNAVIYGPARWATNTHIVGSGVEVTAPVAANNATAAIATEVSNS